MLKDFQFVHGERTFICTVEAPWKSSTEAWWWFRVSSDAHHRYAPFKATPADTRESVRKRVVAYYENLLARRAEPPTSYWRRGAPAKPAATAAPQAQAS